MTLPVPKIGWLASIFRWLVVVLILHVLWTILANYPDYFPPNYDSLFFIGREGTFQGLYPMAFYAHIISSPFVLLSGLILLSERIRRRFGIFHRLLGRVHVAVLLLVMLPGGLVMARHSFGGWLSGASFVSLVFLTGYCSIMGVVHARGRRYAMHRRWMIRTFVLLCSAIALRLISGAMSLFDLSNAELAYFIASWSSWIVPLMGFEMASKFFDFRRA